MKKNYIKNFLILSVTALACILIPTLLIQARAISPYWAYNITLGGINAIMAISVNVVCGITGQLSLGQAGFEAVGAYSTILFTANLGLPLPLSILASGILSALLGFLIGIPTLKLEGDYLAIVTLAFGEIIRVVLVNLKDLTGGPNGMQFSTVFTTSLKYGACISYTVIIASLVLIIVLLQNFLRSTYGRAILSVREDEIAANSTGISVFKYKMTGFVIASFIAGIAGALYACLVAFVKPDLASFNNSINALIYVVLGGMGSITGGIISAFILPNLLETLRFVGTYRLLVYPLILILVMLFRPQGLLGTKELSFIKFYGGIPGFVKKVITSKKSAKKEEA